MSVHGIKIVLLCDFVAEISRGAARRAVVSIMRDRAGVA